jgi:molybdopterin-guanine dinucleotide biosynthesis protein B
MPPVISVIGKSDSGKTTVIEKLIPVLKKRGYKIGIIKHASHGFDADRRGKDSWRHKQAGADTVMVASPNRIAMIKDMACENIDCLMEYFQDVDLVITEGFKKENKPKIEVFRSGIHQEPLCLKDPNLIAFVTDADVYLEVPTFALEEIEGLADLIEKIYL